MIAQQSNTTWTAAIVLMVVVGVALVATGLLVAGIADRTADGRIGPNRWAGIRTRATRSSTEAWLAAHTTAHRLTVLGGRLMALSGVAPIAVGVIAADGDPDEAIGWWGSSCLTLITVSVALVLVASLNGHRAAVEANDPLPPDEPAA